MINLYNGDCLKVMDDLIEMGVKVDAIITDPPYNIARNNNFKSMGRAGIDFGDWDKNADIFSYIDKAYKLLDKNGCFVVFNDWKNLGDICKYANKLGFVEKDILRIKKTNPMPRNRDRRYITDYELAIWFVMPKSKWVFNRQDDKYQRPEFLTSIDKGLHPTQKPLKVISDLVKIHTNKNQTILDPFMGSGTTGVACKNLNRNFIGIELDDGYFNIAQERINNV